MKKIIFFAMLCSLWINVIAQAPQSFKYQAVARDASGNVLTNKNVTFRISIIRGTVTGAIVYNELHAKTTNNFGLVDLEIGKGTSPSGTFSAINWGVDTHFVKVEMDPNGGIAFQDMGTNQLLSVPYALYAKDVQNKDDADADPTNEIQFLSITGANLSLSKGGGTVAIPVDNWGTQVVKTNTTLTGQGTIASPLGVANTVITPSWTNIQNVPAGFADGIDNVNAADTSSTNEIQTLSLSGSQLTLSRNGGTVTLPSSGGGDNWGTQVVKTYSSLTGQGTDANPLGVANAFIAPSWANIQNIPAGFADGIDNVNDADTSITNEIQKLSIDGSNVSLSKDGGTVIIPGDSWGNQVVKTNVTLSGQGTDSSPLGVANTVITPSWSNIQNRPAGFADGVDNVDDADANPTNEIQTLSLNSNLLTISGAGGNTVSFTNWDTNKNDDVNTSGNQTIAGNKWFTGSVTVNAPVVNNNAVNKAYVDSLFDVNINLLFQLEAIRLKDIDNNYYNLVKIGSQVWMAENLKTTKYNDGTDIPVVTIGPQWKVLTTGALCWYNNDAATYKDTYGALYNWPAVNTGKLCPPGWHVPSNAEWTTLAAYLGYPFYAGSKMKTTGTIEEGTGLWHAPNTDATNKSGFSALPGGRRIWGGAFDFVGEQGQWWSSTSYSSTEAWYLSVSRDNSNLYSYYVDIRNGLSIRCVKN